MVCKVKIYFAILISIMSYGCMEYADMRRVYWEKTIAQELPIGASIYEIIDFFERYKLKYHQHKHCEQMKLADYSYDECREHLKLYTALISVSSTLLIGHYVVIDLAVDENWQLVYFSVERMDIGL